MKVSTDEKLIRETLTRSVDKVYPTSSALETAMRAGKRLRMYLGVDPTGPHLHLGHATNLLLLRRLQELGHEIILLIGDFTARIGDPTDKLAARQPLTTNEIKENLKTFKKQASKIISFSGPNAARIQFNSKWHDKMTFKELIKLAEIFTVQQMIERDMFQNRMKAGKPIGLHEFLYPLMQGYDSVAMDVDMEIGGTDQTFNMLAGRTLLKVLGGKEKFVVTTKLLLDPLTGKKIMNKSEGGLVNLDDSANDMFGKVMSLKDSAIVPVAEFSTTMSATDIQDLANIKNPKDAKLRVAYEVVRTYHDEKSANAAQEEWEHVFSERGTPDEMPDLESSPNIPAAELVALTGVSKSEARRLLDQKAVELDGHVLETPTEKLNLKSGTILRVGKKKFFRIKVK